MAASPGREGRGQQDGGNDEKARQDGHGRSRVRGRYIVRQGTRSSRGPSAGMSKYKGRGRVHNPARDCPSRSFRSVANCCLRWNDGRMLATTRRHAYAIRRGSATEHGAAPRLMESARRRGSCDCAVQSVHEGAPWQAGACAEYDAARRAGVSNSKSLDSRRGGNGEQKKLARACQRVMCACLPRTQSPPTSPNRTAGPEGPAFPVWYSRYRTRDDVRTRDRPDISPSCSRSSDRSSAPARPAARRRP